MSYPPMTDGLRREIEEALSRMPHGWATLEKGLRMAETILEHRAHTAVEIGVYAGRSLVAQALAMKYQRYGRVYGIDPWAKHWAVEGQLNPADADWWRKVDLEIIHQACMGAIQGAGVEEQAVIIRAPSHICADLFGPGRIDLLYIDGCHSEEASCRDVSLYLPRVRPGGTVWFDDSSWPTTQKAVIAIRESGATEIGKVDDCLIFRRQSRKPARTHADARRDAAARLPHRNGNPAVATTA